MFPLLRPPPSLSSPGLNTDTITQRCTSQVSVCVAVGCMCGGGRGKPLLLPTSKICHTVFIRPVPSTHPPHSFSLCISLLLCSAFDDLPFTRSPSTSYSLSFLLQHSHRAHITHYSITKSTLRNNKVQKDLTRC